MDAQADRRLMADSLARWLDGREETPALALRQELGAAGWLWPWKDELLLPRAEHVALVAHAIGRADAPVPYAPLVWAAQLLESLPLDEGARLLQELAAGRPAVAVACFRARRGSRGEGRPPDSPPALVVDGADARVLVLLSDCGQAIATLPRAAAQLQPTRTLDGHAAALLAPATRERATVLAAGDTAVRAASHATDWAVLASCGIVAGLLERLVEQTVAFVQDRRQFGVAVGSFQAVQHRAVDMHVAAQELRALLMAGTAAMDTPAQAGAIDRLRIKCGRSGRFVMQAAVQLHGAMGLTEELPVGRAVLRVEAELARHRSPAAAAARLQQDLLRAPEGHHAR